MDNGFQERPSNMFCLIKANIKRGTGGFKKPEAVVKFVGELSKMPKRHVGTGATESRAKEGDGLENVGGQEKKRAQKKRLMGMVH